MEVTEEMRQAVRAEDCRVRGHDWRVLETYGEGPVGVICQHCGKDSGLVRTEKVASAP